MKSWNNAALGETTASPCLKESIAKRMAAEGYERMLEINSIVMNPCGILRFAAV